MNTLLKELGYQLDYDILSRKYRRVCAKAPSAQTVRWIETKAPYFVMAYQAGRVGRRLSDIFPFIKETVPPSADDGHAGRDSAPAPVHIGHGAAVQESAV